MKNKKALAALVFLGTLSVGGVAAIAAFASLMKQENDQSGLNNPDRSNLKPIIGTISDVPQRNIGLNYDHLGLVRTNLYPGTTSATVQLTGLLPYVDKALFVGLYDAMGQLTTSQVLTPSNSRANLTFNNLLAKSKYKLRVLYMNYEVLTTEFSTKTAPNLTFTTPAEQFPQGRIQITGLESYAGANNPNKLYISFKKTTDQFYGTELIVVNPVSPVNDFVLTVTNLTPGATYNFKLVENNNGFSNDVYTYPYTFTVPQPTVPTIISNSTVDSAKLLFFGLTEYANQALKVRYRVKTDSTNNLFSYKEVDINVNVDGSAEFNLTNLSQNLSYEFQIGKYVLVTAPEVPVNPSTATETETELPANSTDISAQNTSSTRPTSSNARSNLNLNASTEVFQPITLFGNTSFSTNVQPVFETKVASFDAATVVLSDLTNYTGQSLTFQYQSKTKLVSGENQVINVNQNTMAFNLKGLDENSVYALRLLDTNGQILATSSFKTFPKVSKQRYDVGIHDNDAVLKFAGGASYLNQDLVVAYRPVGQTNFETKVINVQSNDFEAILPNLIAGTQYQWELIDSGRNLLLANQLFMTKQKVDQSIQVIGNAAVLSVSSKISQYTNNGFVYVDFWTTDKNAATQLVKNVFTDPLEGPEMLQFNLHELAENTQYNYEIYTYQGPIKNVLTAANFMTKSSISENITITQITSTRANVTLANLGAYPNKDFLLRVSDNTSDSKAFVFKANAATQPLQLTNLASGKEYKLELFTSWTDETLSVNPTSQLIQISAAKFSAKTLGANEVLPVLVTSAPETILNSNTGNTERSLSKHVYQFNLQQLTSLIGKTLVLTYWNESQTEDQAIKKELLLTTRNVTWYAPTKLFTDALTNGLRYNFKISVKETPTQVLWEQRDILFNQNNIAPNALALQYSNVTTEGFRATFTGFKGDEGQKVDVSPRPLKNASESHATRSETNLTSRLNTGFKQTATIASDGSFFVDIKFAELTSLLKTAAISVTDFKLLQFYVQKNNSTTEFYLTPLEATLAVPNQVIPSVNLANGGVTENSIPLSFNQYPASNSKFFVKYVEFDSERAKMSYWDWYDGGEITFNGEASVLRPLNNLKSGVSYSVVLINQLGNVLYYADKITTKTSFNHNFTALTTSLNLSFTNPQIPEYELLGKKVQLIVSKSADFVNAFRSQEMTIPSSLESLTKIGSNHFANNLVAFLEGQLASGTGYYYKLVLAGQNETHKGIEGFFNTLKEYQFNHERITNTSASFTLSNLNVLSDPTILDAELVLEYATNSDFSSETKELAINLNANSDLINLTLTGLTKGAKYYYRIKNKKTTGLSTTLNAYFDKLTGELTTLNTDIQLEAYVNKAILNVPSNDRNLLVRYGLNGNLNQIMSSTNLVNANTLIFALNNLVANGYYEYEVINNVGTRLAFGYFQTKLSTAEVLDQAQGSTARKFQFNNISSYQGESLKLQYRKKSSQGAAEATWTDQIVKLPNGLAKFELQLEGLTAATEYEYQVLYQPGKVADALVLKSQTSFTTSASFTPAADAKKVKSVVSTMANFSNTNYTTLTTLGEIFATTNDWRAKLKTSLQYISMTPQRVANGNFLSEWYQLKATSATEDGNISFKDDDSDANNKTLKAYFFFQFDAKKLHAIELTFQLLAGQIQLKLGSTRWIALTSAEQAATLRKKVDFNFATDLSGGEIATKSAFQNGLTHAGYERVKTGEAEGYITVSGLKLVAQRAMLSEQDADQFFNRFSLAQPTININESSIPKAQDYFSVNNDAIEKTKAGVFAIGNANLMMGNLFTNGAESLASIGINSKDQLEKLFTNNLQFGLEIKTDGFAQPQWLFKNHLNISQVYQTSDLGEPLTSFQILWQNGIYYEGLILNLGVNQDGVITLSQNGSALRATIQSGQSLETLHWTDFVLAANPVADYNNGSATGIGLTGLTFGTWLSSKDPGISIYNPNDAIELPKSEIAFS